MASEDDLTSDILDVCVKDVPDYLLDNLKSLVVKHITEAEQFSAQIVTCTGQSAKLKFSLGLKAATKTHSASKEKTQVASTSNASAILVKNIPPYVDEDLLELFFEANKKQGGGPVKCVKLFSDKHCAIVEFEEVKSVDTVMKKIPIKYGQTTLDIQPYFPLLEGKDTISHLDVDGLPRTLAQDILKMQLHHIVTPVKQGPEQVTRILVKNLPPTANEEYLSMFFENSRRQGGGPVNNVEFYPDASVAIVEFKSPDAVDTVMSKLPITMTGNDLDIEIYNPIPEEPVPLCTIEVRGPQDLLDSEMLEMYFENERRSFGGSIREVSRWEDVTLITFESEEVAKRVVGRSHTITKVDLNVSLYKPPKFRPAYSNRLIIKGVNPETSKDCLFNFLEVKSGASPTQLVYGEQDGTVMVTFDSEPAFEKLVAVCKKTPLKGSTLTVSKVRSSNCIIISNMKPTTSSETVQFYFENQRGSSGGEIEKVTMLEESGTCLVFFKDCTVVEDVLKRKHKLEGQEMKVEIYIESLGRSEGDGSEPRLKIPDAFTINDIEEKIVDFMKKSKSCKEAVNKQLEGCYAQVVWPEKGSILIIKCEITDKTPEYRKLVKDWQNNVEKKLKDYLNQLSFKKHQVWQEGLDAVLEGLGEISIENPDAVALFVDKKEKIIRVAGYKHVVDSVSKTVEKVIKDVSDEIEKKNRQLNKQFQI